MLGPTMPKTALLDQTARDLLDLFAAGKNTPGAGSAAALTGALAGNLLQKVARYTVRAAGKPGADESFLERAAVLLEEVRERTSRLSEAVEGDAAAFETYWRLRTAEALATATEIPILIAEECTELAAIGVELYGRGFKPARGEASTALLLALAGGEAAVHIARLNLSFGGGAAGSNACEERLSRLDRRLGDLRRLHGERVAPR
jgi:methenyltetrahydrofolate cyclohydrolase